MIFLCDIIFGSILILLFIYGNNIIPLLLFQKNLNTQKKIYFLHIIILLLCFVYIFLRILSLKILQKKKKNINIKKTFPIQKIEDEIKNNNNGSNSNLFFHFQRIYLLVYFLLMMADWLQGPYVYILYESYGFTEQQIAQLFVGGFGSSMILGTFSGALVDIMGRKKMCIVCCILYAVSCGTKFINSFTILFLGRILAGISTSLIFSSFEAWMVSEHQRKNFGQKWLSKTFYYSIIGNGFVAITSGIIAHALVFRWGYIAPFALAAILLIICALIILTTWKNENYGESGNNFFGHMIHGFKTIYHDPQLIYIGLIQSCFEATMYIFVFAYTPCLQIAINDNNNNHENNKDNSISLMSIILNSITKEKNTNEVPFGLVFSIMMAFVMIGSNFFDSLSKILSFKKIINVVLIISILCFSNIIYYIENNYYILLLLFCIFECCVGIYFPTIGNLRSLFIPDQYKAMIINIYRIPLNGLVIFLLITIPKTSHIQLFQICIILFFVAQLSSLFLISKSKHDFILLKNIDHSKNVM